MDSLIAAARALAEAHHLRIGVLSFF